MAAGVTLPEFGSRNSSTKDLIVSILGEEWPLSAKQLYALVKRQSGQTISYQAVHKALKQLVSEGVLSFGKQGYQISVDWIGRLKRLSADLDSKYSGMHKTKVTESRAVSMGFSNFSEMGRFVVYKLLNGEFNPQSKPSLCLWQHCWPTIGLSDEDYTAIQQGLKKAEHYCVVRGNTFLDKWFAAALEKMGKKCKTGVKPPGDGDIIVEGNHVAQAFFPYEYRKSFNAQYEKIKKANQVDIFNVFKEILGKKAKITLTISKNKELAEQLRKETTKIFRGAKK